MKPDRFWVLSPPAIGQNIAPDAGVRERAADEQRAMAVQGFFLGSRQFDISATVEHSSIPALKSAVAASRGY